MNSNREKTIKGLNDGKKDIEEIKSKRVNSSNEKIEFKENKVLYSGIHNLGNTCYMNAILQCLLHTKELVKYMREYSQYYNDYKLEISQSFFELLDTYYGKKDKDYIIPEKFRNIIIKKHIQFDNKDQHDSHEFLTFILDNLITESEKLVFQTNSREKEKNGVLNPLNKIFFGNLNSTIKCLKCKENNTSTNETFSTLGLSIPVDFKFFVYFIPLKPGAASKMFIKITDSMYLKSMIEAVSKTINYDIKSAIFYSVLNDELKNIFDIKERVVRILNKSVFLFIMENDKDHLDKKIYFPINFYTYDEDLFSNFDYFEDLNLFKVVSYPRVFSFEYNDKIDNIFSNLSKYIQYYLEKNEYYVLVKSNRNMISSRNECVFCNRYKNIVFFCGCLQNLKTLRNGHINKLVNYKFYQLGITVELFVLAKKKLIKNKELNLCKDFTNNPFQETKIDLYKLMNFFVEEEILEDKIYCNSCGNPEYCTKKIQYEKFPKVFIISLKRFRFHSNCYKKTKRSEKLLFESPEKNTYHIDFPIQNLDVSNYSKSQSERYELYAVCYHHGNINSGHYTAVCKINEKWYEFNDKIMREFDEKNIVNSDAYILFYQQKPSMRTNNKKYS